MADPLDDFFASGSAVATANRDPARDPLDEYFAGETRDKANLAITATRSANPETAARANVLARDTGLPPDTVERNLDAVTREQQAIQNRRIIQSNPNLATWATDPRHAAVAHDDLPGLAAVGAKAAKGAPKAPSDSMFGPEGFSGFVGNLIPDIGNSLYAGALRGGAGLYGALAATAEVRDPLNYLVDAAFRDGRPNEWRGRVASFIRSQAVQPITRQADSVRPNNRGFVGNALLSGFESMPQSVAAVALTAAGGPGAGAAALVPLFGAPTFGEEYGKARGKGLEPGEAALYGARQGAVEVITESLPMLFAAKALGKVPFREFLMGYAGKELPSELLATTLQSFDEWVTLNPQKPVAEWLDNLPNELAQTALATLTGSGSMAAISETARVGAEFVDRRQQKAQAQADAEYLADMAAGIADNKTRKRDPSAFAKFMASQMADTGNETTFINAEALRTLYQQQGMDPLQSGDDPLFGWLDSFQRQMQQALASGGEVAVPTAEFLTRFAGTPAWEALKADIRISPDGVSLNEAKTMADGDQARAQLLGAQVAERMAKRQAEAAPAKAIYAEVTRRLAATGMAGDQLKTNAALWTQRAVTRGRRLGVDPLALFLSDNIQVERDFGDGMVAAAPVAAPTPAPTMQPNSLEEPPEFNLSAAYMAGRASAAAETSAVAEPAPIEVASPEVERLAQRYAEMLKARNGDNGLNTRVSDFHRTFAAGIVEKDVGALGLAWNNLNPTARRLFEEATGVKLPKGQAASREAIYAWAGADLAADTAAEDAARASRAIQYEIESARRPASFVKINFDGVSLTGVEFVDARIAEGFTVEKLRNKKTYLINRSTEQAFDLSAKGMAEIGRYARAVLAQRGPVEESVAETPPIADEPMPAAADEVPRDFAKDLAAGLVSPPAVGDTTGMAGMGGSMADAIAGNMYAALLAKLNKGDLTEGGAPSALLQVASAIRNAGGVVDKATFPQIAAEYAKASEQTGPERQAMLRAVVERFSPAAQAPTGPRVIVNIVGSDGLTDAERGGPLVVTPPAGASNTAFTQDQFDKDASALDDWFRQLDQGPAPVVEPGVRVLYQSMPPEVMSAGIRAAGYFIESDSRDYAAYTEAMTARFGPKAGPYLRSWYEAVRYSPDAAAFAGEMTPAGEIEAAAPPAATAASTKMTPDAMRTILEDGGQAEVNGTLFSVAEARNGTWTVKTRGKNEPIGFQRGPGPFESWTKSYAIEEAVKDAFPTTSAPQSAMEPVNVDENSLPERVEGTSPTDLPAPEQGGQTDGVRGPEDAGSGTPDQRPVERPPGERPERAPDGRGAGAGDAAGSAAGIANVEAAPDGTGGDGVTGVQPGNDSGPRPTRTPVPARVVAGSNYVIEPGALSESRGWKQKARDNIAAIRLMQDIMRAGRLATPEEQAVLARYVGFGGLSKLFPDSAGAYGEGWESLGTELRALLNDEEYRTALQSIQYAHYTSETIVRGMWDAAERMGFKGGQIFEPGMGIGNFPGLMPASLRATSHYAGLEMDRVSANIAKLLYPTYGIKQADFIETTLGKDAYDLVIGNPPFADIAIKGDPAYRKQGFLLHDFFFAKSLDALKPGGLLLFITSAGTMNKIDAKARNYMAERADLVASMRLPGDAFKENAGTQVTTDIIILRKRMPGEKPGDQAWTQVENVTLPGPDKSPTQGVMNAYFVANPEQVLGEQGFFDKLYQGRYAVRTAPDRNWAAEFEAAIARLPTNIAGSIASSSVEEVAAAPAAAVTQWSSEKKEGSFYTSSGNLYQTQSGKGVPVLPRGKAGGNYTAAEIERITALVPVRDALRNVLRFDMAGDTDNAAVARVQLNEAYEYFVAKFGPINKAEITEHKPTASQIEEAWQEAREDARAQGMPWDDGSFDPSELLQQRASMTAIAKARAAARDAAKASGEVWSDGSFDPSSVPNNIRDKRPNIEPFMDDPESYRLRAIEHYDDNTGKASKGPVFLRSAFLEQRQPKIESPADALAYVMGTKGQPDMDEIARLSGVTVEAAAEALKGAVFLQPGSANTWLTRGKYLSGNVREKLREAQEAVQTDSRLMNNVEALAAVQPAMLSPAEIGVTIGLPWVPGKVYERFAGQHLGLGNVAVGYSPAISTFAVTGSSWSAAATSTWGTGRMNAIEIMQALLNRTSVRVFDRTSDDKLVLNEIETQAAQDKARAITEEFDLWLNNNSVIADQLAAIYNERFNNSIAPQYDGSWITTPGIAQGWSWRPHQRRVIARIIEAGNTYMAHAVGAGKTSAMIASGMEMRRLGLVKKPMYVVPNHMLGQFTKEFYEQYPAAKISVADERQFHTDKRRQFMANAALDDLDAIIITHASFKKIPISAELEGSIIDEQIEMLEEALREDMGGDRQTQQRTRKQIQKAIQRLTERLKGKRLDKQDRVMTFEEMGVDFLFVDEAHMFRKLDFSTKMTQVKGIAPEGSKASFDLYAKIRHLRRLNPQRHLVMASGTPITNTMAELYSLQRFMQEDALRAQNLGHFDAWAGTYGTTVSALEADAAGGFKTVTRFAKFVNVPELSIMVRQVMDVVTDAQLSQYVVRPALKGGKRIFHGSPRGEMLTNYQSTLADRMRIIQQRKGGKPQPGDDIMLNVINDGRHAAIDMRLVDPALGANGSKLDLLVNEVFRIWQETTNQPFYKVEGEGYAAEPYTRGPAAQMIFANLGVGGARQFNVVDHITRELVARGVPKKEIAYIGNYDTAIEKQRLFNEVNDGKVRILIGSVAKMGAGVNAQRRLVAIHNQDPLWFPADDTQRNGRGIRQGNQNREIEIHDYAAIDTYDAAMWGMMERKARFIEAFMAGDPSVRDMEDLGEASMFEQAKAMTISDQRIMQLTEMRQDAETLRRKKQAWESGLYQARSQIAYFETQLLDSNAQIVGTQQDIAQRQDIAGDKFSGIVNGKTFTKRAEFGKAASEAAMSAFTTAPDDGKARQIEIGAVGGFPLLALVTKGGMFDGFRLFLRMNNRLAEINATTEEGYAASIGNIVRNLEELLSYQQKREAEITDDIATLRRNSEGGAWQGQADLDRLVAEVRALEVELEAEHQAAQAAATASAPVNDEGRTLEQSARGRIRMTGDGAVISLMGTGDESTFLHEMGHRWLEELKTDASGGLSTDQLAGDWQTVKDWFAENGHVVGDDGFIPDDAHELWARGIERYLMEGRAPTNALRAVFQKFATWLKRIYETVEALNTPITQEIRAVMGRLLAADSAVEAQIEAQAAAPLLPDVETAAALGMTAEAHAAYLALAAEAKGDVQAKMLEKMMASVRARRQGQFRDERDKVRADIEAEIAKDPMMVALQLLRTGKRIDDPKAEKLNVRLSRQALLDIFGADVLDTLPRAVPPMIDDERNPIGVHPDELAEMVGLSSGQALVEGLQKVRQQEQTRRESGDKRGFMRGMVEDRIDAIMNERHGGLLSEAEIMAEARDLLANEKQGELYAAELRALSRGTGAGEGGPINTPFRFVRAWASEQMLREKVVNAMTGRFVDLRARTSAKAGREAFDLLAAGDKRGAALAKQRQMVGHALHMEAKQAHDAVTAALSMMKRYARRERAGSIDIEYFDRIKELLALFGFDSRVPANLEGGPDFLEWAMGQINAGVELQMPRGLAGLAFPTWQQLSVADFLSLADTVRNLAALGRTKNKLIVAGQEVEFEELVAEAEATAEALPARKFSDDWNQQTSRVHQAAAGLLKMEKIADWLDNGNPNGVFNRLLIRGAVDAENTRQRLRESVLVPIAQTFLEADKSHRARWDARFTLPELTDRATGRPAVLTGKEMIAVALNMGNEGNIKRITEGHGWQREAIMESLNRHLTQQDWQFVQSVWDQIDTLWPEIVRVERAVRGITPEKIEAEPVVTRFGVFRGGYYPVVYDRDRTDVPNNDAGDAALDMMNQIGGHVTTATGHSISRVDVTAPLLLSLEGVLIGHVQRVVTRIAFAEYARDVLKFVREPRIRRIVRERAGKEYLDQMVPWLRRQVTDGLVDNQGMKGIDRFMRAARVNLTMVAMGLRWSTGIAQAAGLTSSANIIGAKWLAQGMADSLRNRGQITAFVMERSPEMARRNREFDRDVTDFFRSLSGQSSALDKVRGMAFWHIGMIDRHIVAVPTWIGAYKKGLSEGMTESEAAAYGDKAVRTSQGSGRIKDLAAVQAPNSEAYKMFTLFYSYFNVQFNEQWQAAQEVKRGNFHRAMAISWWMLVAAPLAGALLTGDWPDDDKEDGLDMADWAAWAARKVGFGLFAGLPLVRDMASYLERQSTGRYSSYSATPLTRVGDSVIALGRDGKAVMQGDEPSDRWVKHAIETPGYFVGLPTGQVATTSQFLWDVQSGAQSPETVAEWYRGLTKGSVDAR